MTRPAPVHRRALHASVIAAVLTGLTVAALAPPAAAFQAFDLSRWRSDGAVRVIEADRLVLGLAARGTTGEARSETNDLSFLAPSGITEIQVDVTLLDVIIPNAAAGSSQAGITGLWYWDGTGGGTASDLTGHVLGALVIDADEATQTVDVRFHALKCPNPTCAFTPGDLLVETTLLTGVKRFEVHRLRLAYNNATGTFTFQLDGGTAQTFTVADATRNPPTVAFKALRTRVRTQDGPDARGKILALFDDVRVNGAAYDSFDDTSGASRPTRAPRATLFPGTGVYPSTFTGDVVVLVQTDADAVTGGRLLLDGVDVTTAALALAVIESVAGGGVAVRFPGISLASLVPPGPAKRVDVEVDTASGARLRASATWRVLAVVE